MSKNIFVTSLTTALLALPLLAGCKGGGGTIIIPPGGVTLPDCAAGQFLTVGNDKSLNCTSAGSANLAPRPCPPNYAESFESGAFVCVALGTGSTNADLSAAITNLVTKTTSLQNQITNFGGGAGAARYCGLTAATIGRVISGASLGIAAAAAQCQAVAACGAGAHMCTPYEMYESAASGAIVGTQTIPRSWVYMAAWQNTGVGTEPTAGLSDNCGTYTYPSQHTMWSGTAVEWTTETRNSNVVLKFYTGLANAPCGTALPIACCK